MAYTVLFSDQASTLPNYGLKAFNSPNQQHTNSSQDSDDSEDISQKSDGRLFYFSIIPDSGKNFLVVFFMFWALGDSHLCQGVVIMSLEWD